jgi:hypothetical protein
LFTKNRGKHYADLYMMLNVIIIFLSSFILMLACLCVHLNSLKFIYSSVN